MEYARGYSRGIPHQDASAKFAPPPKPEPARVARQHGAALHLSEACSSCLASMVDFQSESYSTSRMVSRPPRGIEPSHVKKLLGAVSFSLFFVKMLVDDPPEVDFGYFGRFCVLVTPGMGPPPAGPENTPNMYSERPF